MVREGRCLWKSAGLSRRRSLRQGSSGWRSNGGGKGSPAGIRPRQGAAGIAPSGGRLRYPPHRHPPRARTGLPSWAGAWTSAFERAALCRLRGGAGACAAGPCVSNARPPPATAPVFAALGGAAACAHRPPRRWRVAPCHPAARPPHSPARVSHPGGRDPPGAGRLAMGPLASSCLTRGMLSVSRSSPMMARPGRHIGRMRGRPAGAGTLAALGV